jgi:hypothetical protein
MAFPASQNTLAQALSLASTLGTKLKSQTQLLRAASAAGPTGRMAYITLQARLHEAITTWATLASTPGIGAYAQEQYGNGTLDIAAEFTAMRNAAITLRDWIGANFPKDATSGAWLVHSYDTTSAVPTELTFTSAVTAQFRTNADAFTATVG